MNGCVSRLVSIVLVTASSLVASDSALAKVRAYSASGSAHFVSDSDFVGIGRATHLGLYDEVGTASFFPTSDPTVLDVVASATYSAANGDQLHAVITGQLDLLTGVITATVSYVGGTGRFADASGSAVFAGQMLVDGTITVTVHGTIDY